VGPISQPADDPPLLLDLFRSGIVCLSELKATPDYNLAVLYAELAREWHPTRNGDLKQTQVTPGSNKKVWWICGRGHEWEAQVADRTSGHGCLECFHGKQGDLARKAALKRSGSLAEKYPVLAREWHPSRNGELTPLDVTSGSHRKVWWKCSQGHEWDAIVKNRTRGYGCPYCSNKKVGEDNNLAVKQPDLAKQWHPTKNGELTPYNVTPGSDRKVWWICSRGHEWEASVKSRSRGSGCARCYDEDRGEILRIAAVKKRGSLAEKYPDLTNQWHPMKNEGLTPYDVTAGSHKKVWWVCEKGHEWEAIVKSRSGGRGCPYCSGRKVGHDNNLAVKYPHLAKEWHPTRNGDLTPYDVTPGSDRKVWWICNRGHKWEARVYGRKSGSGCPHCRPQTSRIEIRIYCELKTIFDDAKWREKIDGIECDIYLPKYKIGVEIDGYPWHDGREERDRLKGNRLFEKGIKVFHVRDNRLNQIAPTDVFYKQNESRISIIQRLLETLTINSSFTVKDKVKIAEYLESNQLLNIQEYRKLIALLPGPLLEKSLAQLYPILADEWNFEKNAPLEPRMFTPGSNQKLWWRCDQRHEWDARIQDRVYKGVGQTLGCPICSGHRVGKDNNLAVRYPELVQEWHPSKNKLTPYDVTPGSGRKIWWKCNLGHEWEAQVADRTRGVGCPYCAGKHPTKENNLAVKHPELVKEWHPTKNRELKPFEVTPRSHKKVWWKCSKGHEWDATVANRTEGKGCPYCSGRRVGEDNNLAVKYPDLAKEWNPTRNENLTPYDVTPGSNRKVWWRCIQGHEWEAKVNDRKNRKGCPYCSGKRASREYNLAVRYPELVKDWHPLKNELTPYDVTPGSGRKIWWKCNLGHEWDEVIRYRVRGRGCPHCYRERRRA